jgi:hypothetical protein
MPTHPVLSKSVHHNARLSATKKERIAAMPQPLFCCALSEVRSRTRIRAW